MRGTDDKTGIVCPRCPGQPHLYQLRTRQRIAETVRVRYCIFCGYRVAIIEKPVDPEYLRELLG